MLHTAAREGAQTALEASDAFVHLDNYTSNHSEISDMSKEENDDMSRNRIRHNLIIGHNPDGTPITRWINGYTIQELIENGAALLYPEASQKAPEKPDVPTFRSMPPAGWSSTRPIQCATPPTRSTPASCRSI